MTKNNAMLGGGPGGLFAAVLAVLAGGIPYDQLPGVRFLPCFPPYPRAGVCSFIVYGRYSRADSLGSLRKISCGAGRESAAWWHASPTCSSPHHQAALVVGLVLVVVDQAELVVDQAAPVATTRRRIRKPRTVSRTGLGCSCCRRTPSTWKGRDGLG